MKAILSRTKGGDGIPPSEGKRFEEEARAAKVTSGYVSVLPMVGPSRESLIRGPVDQSG